MKTKKVSTGRKVDAVVTYIILIFVCFLFFFPVLWLIMASFSKNGSIYDLKGFFPDSFSFAGYTKLFSDTAMYDYPNWLKNTLFVSTGSCIIGTILVILTAYTISRFQFRSKKLFQLYRSLLIQTMYF